MAIASGDFVAELDSRVSNGDSKPMETRRPGGAYMLGVLLVSALALSACDTTLPDVPPPGTVRPQRPRPIKPVDHLDGRVLDEQGQPIASATVWFGGLRYQNTDDQGRFRIRLHGWDRGRRVHNVRVSAEGFRPLTKDVEGGRPSSLILSHDLDAVWTPPTCGFPRPVRPWPRFKETLMWGNVAAFRLSGSPQMFINPGEHGATEEICTDGDCLTSSSDTGGMVYTGIDIGTGFIEWFREIHERDIRLTSDLEGAEYRGVLYDGTFSRWVLLVDQQRIAYHGVSRASADYFDRIIDSMCWLEGKRF